MPSEFNMSNLEMDDGWRTDPTDTFVGKNLAEIGVSPSLAAALDGKTVEEFQNIVTQTIQSGENVNAEMFNFAKELFAGHHDTGYENVQANSVITGLESQLQDAWPTREVQGLAYQMQGSMQAIDGKSGETPLPAALQPAAEPIQGTGYFGGVTPTDRAMQEMKL